VVVIGASAGGVEALTSLARSLPGSLSLSLLVVLHLPRGANSRLAEIIGRAGPLPAVVAEDDRPFRGGRIHVAPPDRHLVLSGDRMHLLDGPAENGFRPAIDTLFRSAARTLGPRAVGVILSGTMDDGVAGLAAIQSAGGVALVQDPEDALCGGLPEAAIDALTPDRIGSTQHIAAALMDLAGTPPAAGGPQRSRRAATLLADPMDLPAEGVDISCPDCGGALQTISLPMLSRYRCRVGHVFSPEALLGGKGQELEAALWAAARTLEETATVSGRLARRSRDNGAAAAARRFEARQTDAARRADLVRQAIASFDVSVNETTEAALASSGDAADGDSARRGAEQLPAEQARAN